MKTLFHIRHESDLFEVSLSDHVIARITCYVGGTHRQDMQYDDLPQKVKDKILDEVEKVLSSQS